MNKTLKWMSLLIVAAIAALTSCGGGAGTGLTGLDSPGGLPGPAIQAGLPTLPDDRGGERKSSAADTEVLPGSAAIQSLNASVVDTTLVLSSTDTELAWGLYKLEGLAGRKVTSLNLEVLSAPGTQYSVGVSNFSEGVWDFMSNGSLPEFEFDLTDQMSRLTSQLGNLYFVVVTSGGDSATVVQATVLSRLLAQGEQERPAFGRELSVSEGLADKIVVQWSAVDGAESYELWRKADIEGQDEPEALLASIPAVLDQPSYSYEDFAIVLGTEYKYKVRAINSGGPGEYTRWRSGWAGATPPVGEDPANELELKGAIELLDETTIQVGGVSFALNPSTIWLDGNAGLLTQADFAVAMNVEVKGDSNGSGGWIARKVQMEEPAVDELTLLGAIESINETSVTVSGQAFAITGTTEWLDINNNPALPADFAVGNMVEVTGDSDGLGGWNARTVKMEDQGAVEQQTVLGAIETLSESSISVAGTAFAITPDTQWLDALGATVTAADFSVGMQVEVTGLADGVGGWNAGVVRMEDTGGNQGLELLGAIEAIDSGSITVQGTSFAYDGATSWQDLDKNDVGPEAFTVGMLVSVKGDPDGAGGWLATRVRMEN